MLVAAGAIVVWRITGDWRILTGALLGGALSLVNFDLLKFFGRKIMETPHDPQYQYFAFIWLRFFALIAICFFLIIKHYVNVAAFAVGLSSIVLAVIIATVYSVIQGYRYALDQDEEFEEKFVGWEDVDGPGKIGYKPEGKKTPFDEL